MQGLDLDVRRFVYDNALSGKAIPTISELAHASGKTQSEMRNALSRLGDARIFALQSEGEILMANPFSAVPTPFFVAIGNHSWYGNCIWDAMGIAAMLHTKALIETSCGCCGTAMRLNVPDDCAAGDERAVHFAIPAARWWENIVFN